MNALRQLFQAIGTGSAITGDDVIALLLLITMIGSSCHLITMLATRWGDRHIAMKSLAGSVLIHGACLLGLEVFEPLRPVRAESEEKRPEILERQIVAQALVESDRDIRLPESGNSAIADRPVQPDVDLHRFETTSPDIVPPEVVEPAAEELDSLSTTAKDVTQFEATAQPEMAIAADTGEKGLTQPAAEDPAADLKTLQEPVKEEIPSLLQSRTVPEAGNTAERESDRVPDDSPPAVSPNLNLNRITRDLSPETATSPAGSSRIPEQSLDDREIFERKATPLTALEPAPGDGITKSSQKDKSSPATAFQPRLPRPPRSTPDRNSAPRPSRQQFQRPQTPIPLPGSYEDVRIGMTAPEFSPSVTTGAPAMEPELPTIRRRDNPPTTYQLRKVEKRADAVRKFGGTAESEEAVELSLRWLSRNQSTDGRWDAEDFGSGKVKIDENGVDRNFAGKEADAGLTALCTLAFLGAGYTHENGRYAFAVDHGLDWLISQQDSSGRLSGKAEHFAGMYCHAMATYALAEAYGMQSDGMLGPIVDPDVIADSSSFGFQICESLTSACLMQPLLQLPVSESLFAAVSDRAAYSMRKVDDLRLRSALAKAVAFTVSQQDQRSGGWRYKRGQEGDVSMFGWQMMSLKSAEIAGVSISPQVRDRMEGFLKTVRQGRNGGLFGYRRSLKPGTKDSEPPTPVMTAEAMFCQQMLGYPRDTPSSRESVEFILKNMPRASELNYYYWYYGTLAMYQYGGSAWNDWNAVVRDSLIAEQRTDGELAGTWDPNDRWGPYGGRLYSTALATLTLEVYYRLLPLYRLNEKTDPPQR